VNLIHAVAVPIFLGSQDDTWNLEDSWHLEGMPTWNPLIESSPGRRSADLISWLRLN